VFGSILRDRSTFESLFQQQYIQVILPLAVRGVFTYEVEPSDAERLKIGMRVVVSFGAKRKYAAIVVKLGVQPPKRTRPKLVDYILDEEPVITEDQLALWTWMADYYLAFLGEVAFSALPQSLRLSSQTVVYRSDSEAELEEFSQSERMVLANLDEREGVTLSELENLDARSKIQRAVASLLEKGWVAVAEEMNQAVKPKTVEMLSLEDAFQSEASLSELFEDLGKAPKQLEVLMRFVELSQCLTDHPVPVERLRLQNEANANRSNIQALISKGVFKIEHQLKGQGRHGVGERHALSEEQTRVVQEIQTQQKPVHLIHGVTGSGKTLVYVELIQRAVNEGKQVLFLVPEIALSTQLVERLRQWLGDEVHVYHSRFSQRERLTLWKRMLLAPDECKIIVGARSSVFLPFSNLGLIIADEEHEASFKQHESSPHYHARDVAIWLGHHHHAQVILGSATPSLETYNHALKGKYGLSKLVKRYGDITLPAVEVADLKRATKEKQLKAQFGPELYAGIEQTLKEKRQAIIFQNRRGFAPFVVCESCGWSAECVNCDVSMTYHKRFDKLVCHYCGYNYKQPSHCPSCGSAKLKVTGFGTEKVEDDLEILFPEARIGRMDLDTTRVKHSFENLIQAFADGSLDILVGTQMITKGLDFDNVALVGVLNADALWSRPDFRAFERAYQLLTQVSGRAGRKGRQGRVIIQTYNTEHPVLKYVMESNYQALYEHQMLERREFGYPPFTRMIKLELAHKDAVLTRTCAETFSKMLRAQLGDRILGPEEPPIARVRNRYLRNIYVKIENTASPQKIRLVIRKTMDEIEAIKDFRPVRIKVDVDPA